MRGIEKLYHGPGSYKTTIFETTYHQLETTKKNQNSRIHTYLSIKSSIFISRVANKENLTRHFKLDNLQRKRKGTDYKT